MYARKEYLASDFCEALCSYSIVVTAIRISV